LPLSLSVGDVARILTFLQGEQRLFAQLFYDAIAISNARMPALD
jgi:hypothetical protein